MKRCIYSFLFLLLSLSPLCVPAGTLEFYSDYNSLLKMEKPELRVSKLLDMLDKYPERADELHPIFFETVYRFEFTPALIRRAEAIRKKYPENLLLNSMLREIFPFKTEHIPEIKHLLLNCPLHPLSQKEANAIIILGSNLSRYYHARGTMHTEHEFFDRYFKRMSSIDSSPEFKYYILTNALDFYRQSIWETDCTAPDFASWKNLPMRGAKQHYHHYLDMLVNSEKEFGFPISGELLNFYAFHQPEHAARYAANFVGTDNLRLVKLILAASIVSEKPELFDHYLPRLQKESPLSIDAALLYAHKFQRFDLLEKTVPADEAVLIKQVAVKDFKNATVTADKIIDSGKITLKDTVNYIVDTLWQTKNRALLAKLWQAAEKDPEKLLKPTQANSIAYAAAVLDFDLDRAEKLSRSAVKQQPNSAILDTYAYILYKQKKFDAAHKFITLAMADIIPGESCAPIYLHAAEIELAYTKNKSRAARFLDRAFKCAKENNSEFDTARAAELQEILK